MSEYIPRQLQQHILDMYEVKASAIFRQDFMSNMKYLEKSLRDRQLIPHLIYDGPSQPPTLLSIRDI